MKILKFLWLFPLLAFCSCHDWDRAESCVGGERREVNFVISLDSVFTEYKNLSYVMQLPEDTATRADSQMRLRYLVKIFKYNSNTPLLSAVSAEPNVTMSVPYGKYKVMVWADFTDQDIRKDLYFHTDDESEYLVRNKLSYDGTDPYKIAFRSCTEMVVTATLYPMKHNVTLTPAMGRYRLVASAEPDYELGKTVVSYVSTAPGAIDALRGNISYRFSGLAYYPKRQGDVVAWDNLFATDSEEKVVVSVFSYDTEGNLRGRIRALEIPFVRKRTTVITGDFYNTIEPDPSDVSGGGITIKTEFDDTVVIPI